jgi:hypothetical protein
MSQCINLTYSGYTFTISLDDTKKPDICLGLVSFGSNNMQD